MKAQYYELVKASIGHLVKSCEWYNNQYRNYREEKAAVLPAAFVEFQPFDWQTFQEGAQKGLGSFRVHCVTPDKTNSPGTALALAASVTRHLHNRPLTDGNGDQVTSEVLRVKTEISIRNKNIKVAIVTFRAEFYDFDTVAVNNDPTARPALKIDVSQ